MAASDPTKSQKITIIYRWRTPDGISIGLAVTQLLVERLRNAGFDDVWLDQDNLPTGSDFKKTVSDRITASDCCVAIFFPGCLERAEEQDDFFRFELITCMNLGKPLIPVLVDCGTLEEILPRPLSETEFGASFMRVFNSILFCLLDTETWDFSKILQSLTHQRQ